MAKKTARVRGPADDEALCSVVTDGGEADQSPQVDYRKHTVTPMDESQHHRRTVGNAQQGLVFEHLGHLCDAETENQTLRSDFLVGERKGNQPSVTDCLLRVAA